MSASEEEPEPADDLGMPSIVQLHEHYLPTLPHTLKHHTVVHIDGCLIVFGGFMRSAGQTGNTNAVFRLDPTALHVSAIDAKGDVPSPRNGHAAVAVGRRMLVFGGWTENEWASEDVFELNLELRRWTRLTPRHRGPGPCNKHTAVYAPSLQQVLVFRGGDGKHYHNDLFAFDVKSRDWVPLEPTGPRPAARASHGAVMWRDDMFIFGGWNGHARMNDLWRLDTRTMCWAEVRAGGPLPSPRTGMGMVATRGLLLAVGGGGEDGVPLGGLLAFDPREERWLEVSCEHRAAARQSPDDDAPSNAGRAPLLVLQRAGGGRPMLALPLMGHAVCVAGTRCFVVGGGNARQPSGPSVAIETDVPPAVRVTARPPTVSLAGGVAELLGSEAFADVVLVAEGCRVPAHRLVLVCTNERFRGMFTSGFREAEAGEVALPGITHAALRALLAHLYTSRPAQLDLCSERGVREALDLLYAADAFLADRLKQECEAALAQVVTAGNAAVLGDAARTCNAAQLLERCRQAFTMGGEEAEQ